MEDAAGQLIHRLDLVKFKTACAHGDRGMVLNTLSLPGGERLVVLCADGIEVAVKPCNVSIVDRSGLCCPCFPVRRASDPDGQAGIVTDSATALDLQNQLHGNKTRVVVDVSPPAAALQRASELHLGDYVVSSGNWLGWVTEVSLDVDVVFDDGAVCRVTSAGRKLRTLDKQGHGNDDGVFYRGQQVAGSSSSVFKASRWLKGYWKPSRVQGTVAKNKVSGVLVQWLATRTSESTPPPPPAYHHDSRNLTFFCSGDANKFWVVSNRCFIHEEPTPTTATTKLRGLLRRRRTRRHHLRRMRQREDQLERSLCIVTNTHTTVDVMWQDGTLQHGVPSESLLPFVAWNKHERVPGQRVIISTSIPAADDDDEPAAKRVGIVRSFNHRDMTACVSWFDHKDKVHCDETLSAYDLDLSPDHDFYYGDLVVRLRATGGSSSECGGGSAAQRKEEDLSWVGYIVDLCCDAPDVLKVKWGDGNMSKVYIVLSNDMHDFLQVPCIICLSMTLDLVK
jgi:ubiquitin-conjugating enzyme E2 O